jgi:hypothetical protein
MARPARTVTVTTSTGLAVVGTVKRKTTRARYHDAHTETVVVDREGFGLAYLVGETWYANEGLLAHGDAALDAPVTVA